MNNINFIQNAIMQLEGGAFQKLFDAYLYKKYKFNNIQTLGVQTGTNKTTKGTPDAYVLTDDKKYILINYGIVVRIMILPNVKDVVSIILTMKMMILCCVITVKSAGIMGLSQLDFEDLRGYAIMIKVLFICHGNICTLPYKQDKISYL